MGEYAGHVLIFYGKTEEDIARELAEFITAETKVFVIPSRTIKTSRISHE